MSTIINPATNKPFEPIMTDLVIEVTAIKTELPAKGRAGAELVTFVCPCGKRNRQSVLRAKSFPQPHVAIMRCNRCTRLLHVHRSRVGIAKSNVLDKAR
jgi:hypothetical protein